jgi:hypothetical protein
MSVANSSPRIQNAPSSFAHIWEVRSLIVDLFRIQNGS